MIRRGERCRVDITSRNAAILKHLRDHRKGMIADIRSIGLHTLKLMRERCRLDNDSALLGNDRDNWALENTHKVRER